MSMYYIFDKKTNIVASAGTLPEIRRKGMAYCRKENIPHVEVATYVRSKNDAFARDGALILAYAGTIQDWKNIRYADGSLPDFRGFSWWTAGSPEKAIKADGTLGRKV